MDNKPRTVLVLWILALLIVVLPGGVISQIWQANWRIDGKIEHSYLNHLCYKCNNSATLSQKYSNGETLYFCSEHKPLEKIRRKYGAKSNSKIKGYNPLFCTIIILAIYLGNFINALFSLIIKHKNKAGSIIGAGWGIFWAIIFLIWFKNL
ncbi:MAG: hypothetical protein V1747_09910 [Candidatus Omnitrophota bacterium]